MSNFKFALAHMPAVRERIGLLPAKLFMGIADAPVKKDLEEATDLIIQLNPKVDIAVRIRRRRYWYPGGGDLSIRYYCRGHRTEIHKLREGFGHYYFMGFSDDDVASIFDWTLFDLTAMRADRIFDDETISENRWQINENWDETAGLYIPIFHLMDYIVAHGLKRGPAVVFGPEQDYRITSV